MKPYVDQVALEVVQIVTARQRATALLEELLRALSMSDDDFIAWVAQRERDGDRMPMHVLRLLRYAELGMRDKLAAERLAYTRELAAEYHRAVARVRQLTRGGEG